MLATLLLIGGGWTLAGTALALVLGRVIRRADRRDAELRAMFTVPDDVSSLTD